MATTVDHLAQNHRIRVIRPFTDADGRRFETGYAGIIATLDFDWKTLDILMEVAREGGGRDSMRFRLSDKDGPGNRRMREYFEVGDAVPTPRRRQPDEPPDDLETGSSPILLPPLTSDVVIDDPSREEEAIARVRALAARHRFPEAREQLVVLNGWLDAGGERSRYLAGPIAAAALAHAWDDDESVYLWLKDWSINLWYQWGSGATSGGDGAARAVEIRAAEASWARLEERRAAYRSKRGRQEEGKTG